jgi:hypothetical protein
MSELAAKAALALRTQGKHQAFHEALLASKGDMSKDTILAVAGEVGLDAKPCARQRPRHLRRARLERAEGAGGAGADSPMKGA